MKTLAINKSLLLSLLVLIMSFGYTNAQYCDNSSLELDNVTDLGNGEYLIDMTLCVAGGYLNAYDYTIDFWFEVYGKDVTIVPGGFTPFLESGQTADGCSNCRAAVGYYNQIYTWDPSQLVCPPTPSPCPSGDGTCIWYTANSPDAPNNGSYLTGFGAPFAPTCPGPPANNLWNVYTDVYSGLPAQSYCKSMYIITDGLPTSIRVKGLEVPSGTFNYCDGSQFEVFTSCQLTADAGADEMVYYGWAPEESANLTAVPASGTAPYTYLWSTGETTENITVSPTVTTTYTVTITDASGCQASDDVDVVVEDVRCGGNLDKVKMCKSNGVDSRCVRQNKVQGKLNQGWTLGYCTNKMGTEGGNAAAFGDEMSMENTFEAYPNPFSTSTSIKFSMTGTEQVKVEVFSLAGKKVATLFEGEVEAYLVEEVEFNSGELANGMYIGKLTSESGEMETIKLIINK